MVEHSGDWRETSPYTKIVICYLVVGLMCVISPNCRFYSRRGLSSNYFLNQAWPAIHLKDAKDIGDYLYIHFTSVINHQSDH